MPDPVRLHLDADTASKALHRALLGKGHDVTRTPTSWMPFDASDEQQLLGATAEGRAIFTFNVRDFVVLAERYPSHRGILLAAQSSWTLSQLIAALDRFLSEQSAEEVAGQALWLNAWGCLVADRLEAGDVALVQTGHVATPGVQLRLRRPKARGSKPSGGTISKTSSLIVAR